MKIGIAGPVSLPLLRGFEQNRNLPLGYDHPPMSALVNAFLGKRHDVVVYTTSTDMDTPSVFRAGDLTVCIGRRQAHAARDLFRSERADLVKLMKEYPVDIMNAHWSYEFAWAALDSGIPTLVTLRDHALTVLKYMPDPYRFVRLLMNHYVLNRAPSLSVNSQYLFERLASRHQQKARVIHNFFAPEIRHRYNTYKNRGNYIISVANGFGRLKNIHSALQAFAHLRCAFPYILYRVVGEDMGPRGAAERYAREAGIAQGVEFLGRLPHGQMLDLLRNAKLMLHSSMEESFGMSVLEAMVVGTPVVGGIRSGNIPSLLDHGKAGVLCDVSKPVDIAKAMSEILQDESQARSIADAARGFAGSRFSEGAVVSKYLEYYSDILKNQDTTL